MKKFLIISFCTFCVLTACQGQNDKNLLNTPIGDFGDELINRCIQQGFISQSEAPVFATVLLTLTQDNSRITGQTTLGECLAFYRETVKDMQQQIAEVYNFGMDTLYLRSPMGDKVLLGMGELSVEKLVMRESEKLPEKYAVPEHNSVITSESIGVYAESLSSLIEADYVAGLLAGNAFLILSEQDILSGFKVGDILEIGKRIKNTKEFAPFVPIIEER